MQEWNWTEQLVEAWNTNNRISLYLLDRISEEGLELTYSKRGGGTPVKQFAHMHNIRYEKLNKWHQPLTDGLIKLSMNDKLEKELLKDALTASGERIAVFIQQCAEEDITYRALKKGLVSSISYLIAHESHHRGNLLLTLKLCGYELDRATLYAIWYWDKM